MSLEDDDTTAATTPCVGCAIGDHQPEGASNTMEEDEEEEAAPISATKTIHPMLAQLPTKQMLCDLRLLQALRRTTTIVGAAGPPVLRVTTVSRSGWSPEWQALQFPGLKLIDLPVFFQAYRKQIADPSCTLKQMVSATDHLCTNYHAIMVNDFERQIGGWGADSGEEGADMLLDAHARDVQRRMFAKALEVQAEDYARYFHTARTEFHLKVAGFMAELSHAGRVMLDAAQGGMPLLEVESKWIGTIAERNRRGALAHSSCLEFS